ncbi:MAG: ATP-binding cassette domain-containing protein [Pseudobdellovibrionaceae bacterium]
MVASIIVSDLCKSFRVRQKKSGLSSFLLPSFVSVNAVDCISFTAQRGERVAFVGPNGAGKSTTIKILSGILFPDSGEVTIEGLTPWKDRQQLAYKIGTVFGQRSQMWYHLPARDSFELLSYAYEIKRNDYLARLNELVTSFNADDLIDKPVRQMSLGERMRCEIIASLLHRPSILFLDEPTVGLDVVSKSVIRDLVKKSSDQDGTTVLLTSHDTGDMERVCNRVIVIDHGKLVTDRPVADLRLGFIKEKFVTLALRDETLQIDLAGVRVREQKPHHLQIAIDTEKSSVEQVLQQAMSRTGLLDITVEDPPMEDIIKAIYSGAGYNRTGRA